MNDRRNDQTPEQWPGNYDGAPQYSVTRGAGAEWSADGLPRRRGRRHTLLWVLGWIFIFPVPLTILMLRNRSLPTGLRYGIIAAGWAVYLLLGWARLRPSQTAAPETGTRAVTVTAPASTPRPTVRPAATPKPVQTERPASTAAPTEAPAATPAPAGVTPEFKATMDSYEAFFDEYVAFLKTLSEDPSNTTLLLQYASMMVQYSETMEALDAIDETELSPADDAYYLQVMTRIEVKLLQATQYLQ